MKSLLGTLVVVAVAGVGVVLGAAGGEDGGGLTTRNVLGGLAGVSVTGRMLMAGAGPTVSGGGFAMIVPAVIVTVYFTPAAWLVFQSPMWST